MLLLSSLWNIKFSKDQLNLKAFENLVLCYKLLVVETCDFDRNVMFARVLSKKPNFSKRISLRFIDINSQIISSFSVKTAYFYDQYFGIYSNSSHKLHIFKSQIVINGNTNPPIFQTVRGRRLPFISINIGLEAELMLKKL